MGWSGSLNAGSVMGSEATYTPDTVTAHEYTIAAFTAPKKAVYRFTLKGSGGTAAPKSWNAYADSGEGGMTTGYLLMEAGDTVYVGAGGTCSAAFVSAAEGESLAQIDQSDLIFVAGAGGQGGACGTENGYNCKATAGGCGGGEAGAAAEQSDNGTPAQGGTQIAGGEAGAGGGKPGSYGSGGRGYYSNNGWSAQSGDGGDGFYGGAGGYAYGHSYGSYGLGGGGGSGYVKAEQLAVGGRIYVSETQQGGGAAGAQVGEVTVTYAADAEIPVEFDGVKLMQILFNGVKVEHLVYNGAAIFMHMLKAGVDLGMSLLRPCKQNGRRRVNDSVSGCHCGCEIADWNAVCGA